MSPSDQRNRRSDLKDRSMDEAQARARLTAALQLNRELVAAALAGAEGEIERAVSILETAIMTLQAGRLPAFVTSGEGTH